MFHDGKGVEQNYWKATKWYRKAAEKARKSAQAKLANMYIVGLGVLHDKVQAHMWGNVAGSMGSKVGAKIRANIEKQMTVPQITKAQRLANECLDKLFVNCGK